MEDGAVGLGLGRGGEDGGVFVWGGVAPNAGEEGGAQGGGFAEGGGAGVGRRGRGRERDDVLKRECFVWVVCTEARDSALRRRPKKQPLRAEAASLSGRWRSGKLAAPNPADII
jgi:hypothetical protein